MKIGPERFTGRGLPQVSCVYRIFDTSTGKYYIGSTNNFQRRMVEHFRSLESNEHHCYYLQRAYTLRPNSFLCGIVKEAPIKELSDIEGSILSEEWEKLFNSSPSSGFVSGHIMTPETRQRISVGNSGKVRTEEVKKRISDSVKRLYVDRPGPRAGVPHTEETRQRLSEANRGKKPSDETIQKVREGVQLKLQDPEYRQSLSDRNRKRSQDPEFREMMYARGAWKRPCPIRVGDQIFRSKTEACEKLQISLHTLNKRLDIDHSYSEVRDENRS